MRTGIGKDMLCEEGLERLAAALQDEGRQKRHAVGAAFSGALHDGHGAPQAAAMYFWADARAS